MLKVSSVGRNNGLPRIAPDSKKPRAKSKRHSLSSPPPNPPLKGTRGFALPISPSLIRPRPLARALGTSKAKRERVLPSGRVSGLESL